MSHGEHLSLPPECATVAPMLKNAAVLFGAILMVGTGYAVSAPPPPPAPIVVPDPAPALLAAAGGDMAAAGQQPMGAQPEQAAAPQGG